MLSFLFLALTGTASAQETPPCSLNGAPAADGTCACFGPWSGGDCSILRTGATPAASGYGLQPPLRSAWGGNVLPDASGVYHLFVAEMSSNCSLSDWERSSFVTHATSTSPLGPFLRQGGAPAIGVWSHNPQVAQLRDGTFAIFHIGPGEGGSPPNCSWPSRSGAGSAPASGASGSTVHTAPALDGPWVPYPAFGVPSCNNPAPLLHPNGTLFLLCDSKVLFRAPSLSGPWVQVQQLPAPRNAPLGAYEDGFIWIDPRGNWHALFHVWSSAVPSPYTCVNANVSAHAFSSDGLSWHYSPRQPYNTTVALDDGSSFITPTRERPKLLFGADGEPTFLYNGAVKDMEGCPPLWCSRCKVVSNHTFNLVVPLLK